MTIKSLRLLIITGDGWLDDEKDNIISCAQQYLDNIRPLQKNIYECTLQTNKFLLYFETGQPRGENAIILKPIILDTSNVSEFNFASYIKILLKIIEDYEIYSLNSVDSAFVGVPE